MITHLATPFVDATPRALSLHMGLDAIAALTTATVEHGDVRVELRLLSASHQILVWHERQLICSETLACFDTPRTPAKTFIRKAEEVRFTRVNEPNDNAAREVFAGVPSTSEEDAMLPRSYVERLDRARYRFSSSTTVLDDEQLEQRVLSTVAQMQADPRALVGQFPGSPLAITGIAVNTIDATSASWTTMHAYPRHRTIVETKAHVTMATEPARSIGSPSDLAERWS